MLPKPVRSAALHRYYCHDSSNSNAQSQGPLSNGAIHGGGNTDERTAMKDVSPIKNVIFDLGGVLLDWNLSKVLSRCYASILALGKNQPDPVKDRHMQRAMNAANDLLL